MSTFNYDTDAIYPEDHDEDCDCNYCHEDWHNPISEWAICDKCKEILAHEAENEIDSNQGDIR